MGTTRGRTSYMNGKEQKWHGMNWISQKKRLAIYLRDRFQCCYCNTDLTTAGPGKTSIDHLVPRAKGGTNDHKNLITVCSACNSARCTKCWFDFARTRGGETAVNHIRNCVRRKLNTKLAQSILDGQIPHPSEHLR